MPCFKINITYAIRTIGKCRTSVVVVPRLVSGGYGIPPSGKGARGISPRRFLSINYLKRVLILSGTYKTSLKHVQKGLKINFCFKGLIINYYLQWTKRFNNANSYSSINFVELDLLTNHQVGSGYFWRLLLKISKLFTKYFMDLIFRIILHFKQHQHYNIC